MNTDENRIAREKARNGREIQNESRWIRPNQTESHQIKPSAKKLTADGRR
jgi:hypothetical protein